MKEFNRLALWISTVLLLHRVSSQPPSVRILQCEDGRVDVSAPCRLGVSPGNTDPLQLNCSVTDAGENVSVRWYRDAAGSPEWIDSPPKTAGPAKSNSTLLVTLTITGEDVAKITSSQNYTCVAGETSSDTITIYKESQVQGIGHHIFLHPVFLAVVIAIFLIILAVAFYIAYRCKKKDEGSYPLNEARDEKELDESGKPMVEFYA